MCSSSSKCMIIIGTLKFIRCFLYRFFRNNLHAGGGVEEIILSTFCQTLGKIVDPTERMYTNLLKF